MLSSGIISLALAASALANVFITNPVSSTNFPAGQTATIAWQDDGNSPTLAQFGSATFAVYVGNAVMQTPVQTIATDIDVSQVSSVTFTPDATIGPDSGEYFIRVTSQTLKDPSAPQYYQEAFSSKFSMSGMSGTFNSTLQAEINGQSTAPIGGPTTSASASVASASSASGTATTTPTSSSSVASSSLSSSSSASSSSSVSASPSATSSNGAAKPVIATGFVGLVAVLLGASLL